MFYLQLLITNTAAERSFEISNCFSIEHQNFNNIFRAIQDKSSKKRRIELRGRFVVEVKLFPCADLTSAQVV